MSVYRTDWQSKFSKFFFQIFIFHFLFIFTKSFFKILISIFISFLNTYVESTKSEHMQTLFKTFFFSFFTKFEHVQFFYEVKNFYYRKTFFRWNNFFLRYRKKISPYEKFFNFTTFSKHVATSSETSKMIFYSMTNLSICYENFTVGIVFHFRMRVKILTYRKFIFM